MNEEEFKDLLYFQDVILPQIYMEEDYQIKKDIEEAIIDPSKMSAGMSKIEDAATVYGVAPAMAEAVLRKNNGMGLGFKFAKENKEAINTFLGIFGINNIDEKIYF